MDLKLSSLDRAMLAGELGPAKKTVMNVIVRMAEINGAESLLDVTCAHIDSSIYTGEASLNFAEKLVQQGAQVSVPSTLNVSSIDEYAWQDWDVPAAYAEKALRQMRAYRQMGCQPVWTCTPYLDASRPGLGECIAWSESNAVVFANSVLGARTERYPGFLDICVAITGRAPASGLYLTENRAARVLVDVQDLPLEMQMEDSFYPVLGYWLGKVCQDQIPVVEHLQVQPTEDQLKSLGAAAASSGGIPMFHMVGYTPEAPTLEDALQGGLPARSYRLSVQMVEQAYAELSTSEGEDLDMVFLGCPHLSLHEFETLASLMQGRACHPGVRFVITTSRQARQQAQESGYLDVVRAFGARVTVDTCVLISPILGEEARVMMTNSAKCAYYAPGKVRKDIHFGNMRDCVNSAVSGKVNKETSKWKTLLEA